MAAARSTTAAVEDASAHVADASAQVSSHVADASAGTWERISSWYSDNKVAAWTIVGVTVVAVGGSIYYLSRPPQSATAGDAEKKSSKKSSKKKAAKKDAEKAAEEGAAGELGDSVGRG